MKVIGKRRLPPVSSHESPSAFTAFDRWRSMRMAGDKAPPEVAAAAAAEILARWERDEDRQIPLDPDRPEDAEKILRTQERIGDAAALAHVLGPAAAAVYACLDVVMRGWTAGVAARLTSPNPHLLIVVKSPTHDWHDEVKAAFGAWIAAREAERDLDSRFVDLVHPVKDFKKKAREFRLHAVMSAVVSNHVLAAYQDDETVPDLLSSLADAVIDLSDAVGPIQFAGVVAAKFAGERPHWPGDLFADRFKPDLFEAALMRAREPDDVHRVVESVLLAEAVETINSATDAINAETKKAATPDSSVVLRPQQPVLADLHGYGAAKIWGETLATDLADYRAGKIAWADVDAGCLLHGPPGTGKTLFASALAASCQVAFISASFATWQGPKGGHLGDIVQEMQRTFAEASKVAPCIVFIDEIDAIPARGSSRGYNDYWTPIVTALLECLDGTARREGVVVVAACNDARGLDPALVRSGRLDRRFEIGLPDEEALARIFAHHLPGLPADVLDPVATALAGVCSGADAARISRDARRTARRAKREVVASDLLDIALPPDSRPDEVRRMAAVHEAGHAVLAMLLGHPVATLSIVETERTNGGVTLAEHISMTFAHDLAHRVMFVLGGRAAEDVILSRTSLGSGGVAGSDLHIATGLIRQYLSGGEGFGLTFGVEADAAGIDRHLQRLYAETVVLVGRHRRVVEALAELALEKRVLGRKALAAFAAEHLLDGGVR